ncbi:protein SCO1/2 [Dinghuibacter silviterrae]|uniref:Protein SCO1/2 n=2 Tax=Dinghuibacter silviterrae TaxID=1539049 RepID=A0A4R8DNK9_9BACT|nr:protein SCO1/2 [Dinghuibacter silviterrae]
MIVMCVVIFVPLICYFLVKAYSEKALVMPGHYIADTIVEVTDHGKQTFDTVWHVIPDFTLTNQLGQKVSLQDAKGKIIVADFFFTHCPSFCPTLTRNMQHLQQMFLTNDTIVQFVSFSVDPERDSVPVLKEYADRFGVLHHNWWMLTGSKDSIYTLAERDFKVAAMDSGHQNFVHTDRMVLLDKDRFVRGYYNGQDTADMARLAGDIVLLTLEKKKNEKRNLFNRE